MHQGGIVQTPSGEWWGLSMMDHNSVGRLTCLSPVTWRDGWPYFGLPGNLTRTPLTWVKPDTGHSSAPHAPYERNDDFSGPRLQPIWQWNHVPDDAQWSLTEKPGVAAAACPRRPGFLDGAGFADAAGHRSRVDGHGRARHVRDEARRHRRPGAAQPAVRMARRAARRHRFGGRVVRSNAWRDPLGRVCPAPTSGCASTATSTPKKARSATASTAPGINPSAPS